jgi:hypothetical protein
MGLWLLCGVPSPLYADWKHNEFVFEPGAGMLLGDPEITNLNQNVDSLDDSAAFFGAQYLWNTNETLGFGLDMNYLGDSSASRRLVSGAPTAWQTKTLVMLSVVRYTFVKSAGIKPYVVLGLGAHRTTLSADDNLKPIIDSSRWGIASAIGAGLNLPVREPFVVGAEARVQVLSSTHYPLLDTARGMTLATGGIARPSSFEVLLRTGFRF